MNSIDEHTHIFYTFTLTIKFVYTPATLSFPDICMSVHLYLPHLFRSIS